MCEEISWEMYGIFKSLLNIEAKFPGGLQRNVQAQNKYVKMPQLNITLR